MLCLLSVYHLVGNLYTRMSDLVIAIDCSSYTFFFLLRFESFKALSVTVII